MRHIAAMGGVRFFPWVFVWLWPVVAICARPFPPEENPLYLPAVGSSKPFIITPTILELSLTTTKPEPAEPREWKLCGQKGASPTAQSRATRRVFRLGSNLCHQTWLQAPRFVRAIQATGPESR